MATLKNRQNLTAEEAVHAIEFYTSSGRVDTAKSDAANNEIFHTRNVILTNVSGSLVKDTAATIAKHKVARDKILSDNR